MDPKVAWVTATPGATPVCSPEDAETSKSPPRFLPRAGSQYVAAISAYLRIGIPSSNHLLGFGFVTDDRPHLSHTRRSALEGALHSCRRQHEGTSDRIVVRERFVKDCASARRVSSRAMATGFQCATCGKWHDELPLDLGYAEPLYVAELDDNERSQFVTTLGDFRVLRRDGETHHFVRGVIEIPIVGMNECFRYGVWASLGHESFKLACAAYANDVAAGPFFGWVSNQIE